MDDFLYFPDKYVGYPMTVDEAVNRLNLNRFPLKERMLLSAADTTEGRIQAKVYLWSRLASGELHSFAQSPDSGAWYRVPAGYWVDHRKGLNSVLGSAANESLATTVQTQPYLLVPPELVGQPICLWQQDVDQLLDSLPQTAEAMLGVIATVLNVDPVSIIPEGAPRQSSTAFLRGVMPPTAKPNDRRHEELAHQAAELVRDQNILPGAAFEKVAPDGANTSRESVKRAIRSAYDLMYERSGQPRRSGQN